MTLFNHSFRALSHKLSQNPDNTSAMPWRHIQYQIKKEELGDSQVKLIVEIASTLDSEDFPLIFPKENLLSDQCDRRSTKMMCWEKWAKEDELATSMVDYTQPLAKYQFTIICQRSPEVIQAKLNELYNKLADNFNQYLDCVSDIASGKGDKEQGCLNTTLHNSAVIDGCLSTKNTGRDEIDKMCEGVYGSTFPCYWFDHIQPCDVAQNGSGRIQPSYTKFITGGMLDHQAYLSRSSKFMTWHAKECFFEGFAPAFNNSVARFNLNANLTEGLVSCQSSDVNNWLLSSLRLLFSASLLGLPIAAGVGCFICTLATAACFRAYQSRRRGEYQVIQNEVPEAMPSQVDHASASEAAIQEGEESYQSTNNTV